MADDRIRGDVLTLGKLFNRVTYAIEYYQREYEWSAEHVQTLLTDLFEEFESAERGRTIRRRRERPTPFFLGPFVYVEEDGDRRFLVDGQQRFTTLHLIFLHLFRQSPDTSSSRTKYQLDRVIVADEHGRHPRFRLDIEERQAALEALFNNHDYEAPFGASLSVRSLWDRSSQIEDVLRARLDSERHGRFVEWLLDSVVMVGIEAPDRNNGFRIFESMNDRGARLTPVDLVKSYLLSKAHTDEEKLNKRWRDMLSEVTRVRGDAKAPLDYLKAVLLARYANLGDGSLDPQEIDLTPHMWIRRNSDRIGLRDGDDSYSRFVENLVDLGKHYADLATATTRPYAVNNLTSLYYNHVNGLTTQMALVMAAVQPDDTRSQAQEKARIAANFIDLLYVVRAVHDEPTSAEDMQEEIFRFIPLARACSTADELAVRLGREAPDVDFDVVRTFSLRGDNRAQVRYLLARLTAHVENEMNRPVEIEKYLSADRSWQIEHLFANHAKWHPDLDPLQFRLARNRLGGLGLLPHSDNASIQDFPFDKKVHWYARHNSLLAVLSPTYAHKHPTLTRLRNSHGLQKTLRSFGPSPSMPEVIEVRGELYRRLFRRIWDPAGLGLVVPEPKPAEEPAAPAPPPAPQAEPIRQNKSRRPRRTPLGTFVASGRINPGTRLHGIHENTRREAVVDAQGLLWLSDVDSFRSPDEAGMMVTGRKTCTGWTFWHITLHDRTAVTLRTFRDNPDLSAQTSPT